MAEVEFIFNSIKTVIQCNIKDKMKDIIKKYGIKLGKEIESLYIIYDSNIINEELMEKEFIEIANNIDKERKKMNILVYEINTNIERDKRILSKEIICPECKENIRINISNYKIKLFECKNGHNIDNILLNEFYNTQYIDESKIICNKCNENNKLKSYNNIFYKCNKCKINLCPLCKLNHDNKHNIINYELKDYICDIHNKEYISYCKECKKNKCIICLEEEGKQ
jgi:hypothetical protein